RTARNTLPLHVALPISAPGRFHEIHIRADLATCERRDPKGLYKRARTGEIPDFTGISAPYEPPLDPELVVDTTELSIEAAVDLRSEEHTSELQSRENLV